ncbi:hypothetical protein C8Q77DRAFT_1072599 [Trametes polyzona]|nr:hypothetical protein C8Q77DRAFT_1072599 [Trametes polyzona]
MAPQNGPKPPRTEVLEVEDEEQHEERIQSLLSRLNATTNGGAAGVPPPPRPFGLGDGSALPPAPPLELLSRVQAFLPELAASNAELVRRARENPESVDIEHIGDDQEQYIEMNLGLGVFDHRGELPPGIPVADVDFDAQMEDSDSDSDSSSSSSSDDSRISSSDFSDSSSSSSDEENSDADMDTATSSTQEKTKRPTKPLPKRGASSGSKKPEIVVLSETVDDASSSR